MGILATILLSILASLIAAEVLGLGKLLERSIISKSVEWLPEDDRDRLREELFAHLNELDGLLVRLVHALSFAISVSRIAAELRGEKTARLASRRVSVASLEKLIKGLEYRMVIWLAAFLRAISFNSLMHGLKFLKGTKERLFSFSQMAKIATSIAAVISVLIRIPPGPVFIESHYNPATDPHVKIEARGPNRATGSSPSAGQPTASLTSQNSGGVALIPDRAEAVTRSAPRVNSGVPWDTSITNRSLI